MDKVLKVGQQSLLGYLPAIMIKSILDGEIDPNRVLPAYHSMTTVSLFADISGFTKLSEVFAKKGRIGPEFLAFSLNRYMEQLSKNGGDIFKFAGDALLVVWPENKSDLASTCRRAIQCALDIQSKLNKVEMSPGKPLSVKIGLGVGDCRVLFVGGQFKRCEYLIVGEAMRQACESETHATEGGQTIISQSVYNLVKQYYEVVIAEGDGSHGESDPSNTFYKILKSTGERLAIKSDAYLMRTRFSQDKLKEKLPILKTFVPAAISIYLDIEQENWSKEIRMLTVMFLNLKVDLSQTKNEEGMKRIQDIVHVVQRCVYRTKGSLNKFLMDDKGSVMLICWGLPPLSAPDDPVRSVLTALDLAKELKEFNCGAYMGIATGTCFTGVCGTIGGRREYSLLGEMVNLSARHMQRAIYYAKDQIKQGKKTDYVILLCEKTRKLIQNKVSCDYVCDGELKGFTGNFYFYEPKVDNKSKLESPSIFLPEVRTHRNNVLIGKGNPSENTTSESMLRSALFMVGRKHLLEDCLKVLNNFYKNNEREYISIRGVTGSGKSLFIRRAIYEFLEHNRELKTKMNNNLPFIFVSFQTANTAFDPLNGFGKIVREIYNLIKPKLEGKNPTKFKLGGEVLTLQCDAIGELLLNSDCISFIRYIEEILETSLSSHYELPNNPLFDKFFEIRELPKRDTFFEFRRLDYIEKNICTFFVSLVRLYQENYIPKHPLILIIEDAHAIDDISINLIKALCINPPTDSNKNSKGVCIITSYQDEITQIIKNSNDKFSKHQDLYNWENTFVMENLPEIDVARELLRHSLQAKIETISESIINIILTKSFKGIPLFMIEILHSLMDSGLVESTQGEIIPTDELHNINSLNDWSNFTIPLRMEKILGNIIDNLTPKEIILLKYASVIGNLFDIDKLSDLNPFNSITFDDLYTILRNLENLGLIEVLYDLKPKHMVCQFAVPFLREILFQRMLIEQRGEIHLNIARKMQYSKFSYMPHKMEGDILKNHLKITEKTILKHMEEKDDEVVSKKDNNSLNINNLKITLVKDICERLKMIDLRLESEEIDISKRSLPIIKAGYIEKKSDKYVSWESRYFVITNTKLFYWYHQTDYHDNKMPLGSFELKHLYSVEILRDKLKGDKNNLFHLGVSSWSKKNKLLPAREYYFSCQTRDELYNWVITLNFLRVKAMYDEFSANFGLIALPLNHEIRKKSMLKQKVKFQSGPRRNLNSGNNLNTGNLMPRKSAYTKSFDYGKYDRENSVMRRVSINSSNFDNFDEMDIQERIIKIKENLASAFSYSFACFYGFIQEVIFTPEHATDLDDRSISIPIPPHLEFFKNLTTNNRHSGDGMIFNEKNSFKGTKDIKDEPQTKRISGESKESTDKFNSKSQNKISQDSPSIVDNNLSFHEGNDKFVLSKRDRYNEAAIQNMKGIRNINLDKNDDQLEEYINNISANLSVDKDEGKDNRLENQNNVNFRILSELKTKENAANNLHKKKNK